MQDYTHKPKSAERTKRSKKLINYNIATLITMALSFLPIGFAERNTHASKQPDRTSTSVSVDLQLRVNVDRSKP